MKKFFAAVLCTALIAAVASGCGYSDALNTQTTTASATSSADASTEDTAQETDVKASDFDDSFDGLCEYFAELGYIDPDGTVTEMDASLIGAQQGNKYTSGKLTVELYVYDTDNLNDTADEIIESVKNDGTFTILDLSPVTAYLSDNGKYLMIYTDSDIDDDDPDEASDNYIQREEAVKNFKAFHK